MDDTRDPVEEVTETVTPETEEVEGEVVTEEKTEETQETE